MSIIPALAFPLGVAVLWNVLERLRWLSVAGSVVSVAASRQHEFSKKIQDTITIRVGHGVEGDSHGGATVQHLSRVARDPTQPNLRQVRLLIVSLQALTSFQRSLSGPSTVARDNAPRQRTPG